MENKAKHLEMIQEIIGRMSNNLFLLKGWGVTVVTGLLALLAVKDSSPRFVFLTLFPIIVFWILDGYFLSHERRYRSLYDQVAKKSEDQIDFSMNIEMFKEGRNGWIRSMFSKTLNIFYGLFLALLVIIISTNYHEQIKKYFNNKWQCQCYSTLPRNNDVVLPVNQIIKAKTN